MQPLRVGIDARLAAGQFGGIEQAIIGLAAALSKLEDGDEEYLFLVHPDHEEWLRPYISGPCRLLPTPIDYAGQGGRRRLRRALRERMPPNGLKRAVIGSDETAERAGVELIHFAVQDAFTTELPSIYEPYDLQHLHLPEMFGKRAAARREVVYRTHCERASVVVAMSSWTKRDLIRNYGLAEEKVRVVPRGSVLDAYPAPTEQDRERVRAELGLPDGFLLYPAQTWPHKNHERLIEALAQARDRTGTAIPLVCPGRRNSHYGRIESRVKELGLASTTWFPGFLGGLEVRALYELATALIFPSRFEGWGLPVTEAFSTGLPVAASTATGLPDLVGDAGLLFDPDDTGQIADAAGEIWTDADLRARLAERGRRRAELFSFDHAARLYRAVYRQLADRTLSEEDRGLLAAPPPA